MPWEVLGRSGFYGDGERGFCEDSNLKDDRNNKEKMIVVLAQQAKAGLNITDGFFFSVPYETISYNWTPQSFNLRTYKYTRGHENLFPIHVMLDMGIIWK